jgi:hypothetical protein
MLRPLEGLLERRVSEEREKLEVGDKPLFLLRRGIPPRCAVVVQVKSRRTLAGHVETYLGGDDIFNGGEFRLTISVFSLSVYVAEVVDATEASVDSAGSWIDALLPCRCCENDATVELDEGRDVSRPPMSAPIDGSSLSSSVGGDAVLKAARLKTCSIEGRRKESLACGRGRIEVASAEAVMFIGRETRRRFPDLLNGVLCVYGMQQQKRSGFKTNSNQV